MKSINHYLTPFIKTIFFGLLVLLLILSCQNKKSSSFELKKSNTEIETEVKKEIEALYDVYNKSNLKWVDFYKDVYTFAANDGSIKTKYADSLRIEWEDIYNKYEVILEERGKPTVIGSGDQVFHYNSFDEIFIKKSTNDTTRSIGTWVVLWKKQKDNSWKIEFETYHSK